MRKTVCYIVSCCLLAGCQHELHFPEMPPVVVAHEKFVSAVVVTNPGQIDYDSIVFRYGSDKTKEVHYNTLSLRDSVTRTYYYDAAGRLSKLEDENAVYYTNNNKARRISFIYNDGGQLQQTITDFTNVQGIKALLVNSTSGANKQTVLYDTAYTGAGYNLEWTNRVVYSTISNSNYILYDSAVYFNTTTTGLSKTIVNDYQYSSADSSVTVINKRIYFNHQLSEYGVVSASSDKPSPVFSNLRKKLYRNLANWFETGLAWQDDNYRLFPLPGGPYRSILYKATSLSAGAGQPPYTRDYRFDNTYNGDELNKSVVDYSLLGQGTSKYTTVLRFYYKD